MDWFPINEVSDYPLYCTENFMEKGNCPGTLGTARMTAYKVFEDRQEVIYWRHGLDETPRKMANCAVRNKNNWACTYSDGSGPVVMIDGIRNSEPDDYFKYVSKFTYYRVNWGLLTKEERKMKKDNPFALMDDKEFNALVENMEVLETLSIEDLKVLVKERDKRFAKEN